MIVNHDKWVRGLLWEEIDTNLVLRKQTTFGDITFDLHMAPMVMAEFAKNPFFASGQRLAFPLAGPVVVNEYDNRPWDALELRRCWRKVADAAGVPEAVKNMDSRKGE